MCNGVLFNKKVKSLKFRGLEGAVSIILSTVAPTKKEHKFSILSHIEVLVYKVYMYL